MADAQGAELNGIDNAVDIMMARLAEPEPAKQAPSPAPRGPDRLQQVPQPGQPVDKPADPVPEGDDVPPDGADLVIEIVSGGSQHRHRDSRAFGHRRLADLARSRVERSDERFERMVGLHLVRRPCEYGHRIR